jgi:hypothetical protein
MDTNYLIVRNSGKREGNCYIDYLGKYKLSDIAKETKIDAKKLCDIYTKNGGILEPELEVYYFENVISAKKAVAQVIAKISVAFKGRSIYLTESEIDTIRRALISDGAVAMGIGSKIKDSIFKKLND